jgi:chromosome segregation ATPase
MEDLLKLFVELRGAIGGAAAIGVSVALWLWSNRNSREMAGADANGQIKALSVYDQLLKTEREQRALAEQRADQFAKERNEAYQQVWELKGQMKAMTEQLALQNQELNELRDQVRGLKEQMNAKQ